MKLDPNSSILPGKFLGGIAIGARLQAIYQIVRPSAYSSPSSYFLEDPFYIRYNLSGAVAVTVHILNSKIIKIAALKGYKGSLPNGICLGMTIGEALVREPNLYFDEDNEMFYIKSAPGVSLESEQPHNGNSIIQAITVFLPSLLDSWDKAKEAGEW